MTLPAKYRAQTCISSPPHSLRVDRARTCERNGSGRVEGTRPGNELGAGRAAERGPPLVSLGVIASPMPFRCVVRLIFPPYEGQQLGSGPSEPSQGGCLRSVLALACLFPVVRMNSRPPDPHHQLTGSLLREVWRVVPFANTVVLRVR